MALRDDFGGYFVLAGVSISIVGVPISFILGAEGAEPGVVEPFAVVMVCRSLIRRSRTGLPGEFWDYSSLPSVPVYFPYCFNPAQRRT